MEQQVEGPEQVTLDKKELTNEQVKIINRLIRQCYIPCSNECVMAVPPFCRTTWNTHLLL